MLNQLIYILGAALLSVQAKNSCSFATTITASSAISQLNSCPTIDGKVEITGDEIASLDLSSVKEIKGDIKFFNSSSVTDISLHSLKKITGSVAVDAYLQLHSIDFSSLTEMADLSLISLPSFAILTLGSGISSAKSLEISDTALSTLQGLNFDTIGTLNVNNNKNISSIDLSTLESVSENLILSFNSDDAEVKLDYLSWASNVTVQDVSEFSASNLTTVNGSISIGYNTFESFSLDELKKIGGSLQVFANDDLGSFSLEKLKSIGGELRIYNNSALKDMGDTFEKLETVTGAVNIKGPFANLSLSNLEEVDGDFTVVSTSDEFDCDDLDDLKDDKKIKGHNYKCSAKTKKKKSSSSSSHKTGSSDSSGSDSSDSSDSSSSSSSSKKDSGANALMASTAVIASIFTVLFSILI